jgi:hypothetical protein
MRLSSETMSRLTLVFVALCSGSMVAKAQTSAELRARYGAPQTSETENNRPILERYLVRPTIAMTIRYTKDGQPCEVTLKPVPGSTPKEGKVEHAPECDYMATAEVIKVINELVPPEKRGRRTKEGSFNGGDPEMKLHHPGCAGVYFAWFENVAISCSTWCWGGTFSAMIRWGKETCGVKR